jgi:galacturonosyltransferase
MKKILILANNDVGLYNFRFELIKSLIYDKYNITISCPYGKNIKKFLEIGCKFIDVNIDRRGVSIIKDLKLLYFYYKLISKDKPDIVLTYTIKPNIYGGTICEILKVPYSANITGLGSSSYGKIIIKWLTIILYKIAMMKSDTIYFQNKENMEYFSKHKIRGKKSILIPGSGVNISHFRYFKYPDNDKSIEFAFISRIMKEKGIEQYLEAITIIKEKYPNTVFHVCGFCEERYEAVLEELSKKNLIVYHGVVDDIREIYKIIHCVIHPTYYPEGISNVLLESCACGRPIITTNISGCKEIVDDGINGFIVNIKDTMSLIEKIEKFILLGNDQKEMMGLNARGKVEIFFNRDVVINEYRKNIKSIVNKNK